MEHKRPIPLMERAQKRRSACPVCNQPSYSRGGIHPQCAAQRADASRMARVKAAKKTAEAAVVTPNTLALAPWHKRCPKCDGQVHIRKASCDCGHRF